MICSPIAVDDELGHAIVSKYSCKMFEIRTAGQDEDIRV